MTAEFLKEEDVVLRPIEKNDADFLGELFQGQDVRKYLGRVPLPRNRRRVEEKIEEVVESDDRIQFIVEKDGKEVGTIMLFDIDRTYRHAEFGAFMVDPDFHGEGIGSTALKLLLDYAFNELNMHRIAGGHVEGNEASMKVQEEFGFEEEGRERDYKYRDGEYLDLVRMSLLEDEWRN